MIYLINTLLFIVNIYMALQVAIIIYNVVNGLKAKKEMERKFEKFQDDLRNMKTNDLISQELSRPEA